MVKQGIGMKPASTAVPRVSVIMPCYNHGRFVSESAAAVLAQTFSDLELIVVDDASTDNSMEVLRTLAKTDSRVKIIAHEKNRGPSGSRNDGVGSARGEFVAFCDADDIWKPEKLARQIRLLEEHPDCDITYCESEIIDETGRRTQLLFSGEYPVPSAPSGNLFEALCTANFINTQTLLARRSALGDRLAFDERVRLAEDWWLWIRLARHHRFVYDSEPLALYRVHTQSTGLTQKPAFSRSRCKVAIWTLHAYADLPLKVQSQLLYLIGRQLCYLGKGPSGRRCLLKSVRLGWAGRLPLRRLARMAARTILEWSRISAQTARGAARRAST
jgi:glycosyltransferase involved in cell wall biosynthesis